MNNKVTTDDQIKRMKALMNYGINESKQPAYSSVEYSKLAADGKLYGIVREGTNYYIKVAKNPKGGLISENFDYINGFRNRNNNKFNSFASAQRFFGEKMMGINENVGSDQKKVIAEAWNLDEKKEVIEEQTKKVQKEIARQRQIMENAVRIAEGKKQETKQEFDAVIGKDAKKNSESPKCNAKGCECVKDYHGKNVKGGVGAPYTCCESAETPLTSRENPDYMDMAKGTKIGKNSGFGKMVAKAAGAVADEDGGESENTETPEKVNEGVSMHDTDNQNSPKVGTGSKGKTDPFDENVVSESLDDLDDELEDDDEDLDDDEDTSFDDDDLSDDELDDDDLSDDELEDDDLSDDELEDDDLDDDEELEIEVEPDEDSIDDLEDDVEVEDDDINTRMDGLEDKLDTILDAINNMKYDDEPLYDDDDSEDENNYELELDNEEPEDEDEDDDTNVVESKSYRAMRLRKLNESKKGDAWKERFDALFGGNPFDEKGCKELGLDANELYCGRKKAKKSKKEESFRRNGMTMNEENRLDYFAKHPAYGKKVMTLPSNDNFKRDGQYDMNDSSLDSEEPYGKRKGSSAPFKKPVNHIENAIAESVFNIVKKKLG